MSRGGRQSCRQPAFVPANRAAVSLSRSLAVPLSRSPAVSTFEMSPVLQDHRPALPHPLDRIALGFILDRERPFVVVLLQHFEDARNIYAGRLSPLVKDPNLDVRAESVGRNLGN